MVILCDLKDYNESKRSDQPVISTILGRFCNKRCTVHYIINMISKAGADVVRTITSNKSYTVHYIINVISKAGADVVRTITSLKNVKM